MSDITQQVSGRTRTQTRSLVPESMLSVTTLHRVTGCSFWGPDSMAPTLLREEVLEGLAVKAP